jgi:hypothetical protein
MSGYLPPGFFRASSATETPAATAITAAATTASARRPMRGRLTIPRPEPTASRSSWASAAAVCGRAARSLAMARRSAGASGWS